MSDDQNIVVYRGVKDKFALLKALFRRIPKMPWLKTKKGIAVSALVLCVLVAGTAFVYWGIKHRAANIGSASNIDPDLAKASKYLREKNTSQALDHARKALANAPNDPEAIEAVAVLTAKDNPDEARQLYSRLLFLFKQQDNPDESGKRAVTYWAAAQLAEKAGLLAEAKQYYQKVIDAAKSSSAYEQSLRKQSQAALKRLP